MRALLVLLASSACAGSNHEDLLLLHNVNVIDPSENVVLQNHCIWIKGDRIRSVEPCTGDYRPHRLIDGKGKWVIPGLWDMHVHALWDNTIYRKFFSDFVAYGVVGIRDMGGDPDTLLQARKYLSEPGSIGPELIAAVMVVDGPEPIHPEIAIAVDSVDDATMAVAAVDELGADFVKIYTTLPEAAVRAVFEEAQRRDLPVVGHLPVEIELVDAIEGGMAAIEHMAVESGGLCNPDNETECKRTYAMLRDKGIYLTPTLLVRQRPSSIRDPDIETRSRIASMPPAVANEWKSRLRQLLQTQSVHYVDEKALQFRREQRQTEFAIAAGSLIMVGTDCGDFLVPPGSSIHEELQLMVAAGMDEMTALNAATGRAADFLRMNDRGRIESGAVADLLILNDNPITDIRHTRDIDTVILKGRVFDSRELACMKLHTACH